MTVGTADLHKAINTVWNDNDLDDFFTEDWAVGQSTSYPVLNDQKASPGNPFPYCVLDQTTSRIVTRMSDDSGSKRYTISTDVTFKVHAKVITGDARSAKQIASDLAAEIMKIYGGHPTVQPQSLELDNGTVPNVQFDRDYGIRTGDDEYQWNIHYRFLTDVPVRIIN